MKKTIELVYEQTKKVNWLNTPIGTIWKSCETPGISGHFITPVEDIEDAPIMVNYDIFDEEDIWTLLTGK
jgi:hypothetical protein